MLGCGSASDLAAGTRAFRQHRRWGLGSLVFAPVGFVFCRIVIPVREQFRSVCAWCVCWSRLRRQFIYSPCRRTRVRGRGLLRAAEKHLTLTGSDPKTAPDMNKKQDVAVLQMANPEVNDQSLEKLKGMKLLRELDLNGSQVTDAGLVILKELPELATLRLARTKITDKGFRETLLAKESLMQLDLRGTPVSRETIQDWREAKSGRRVFAVNVN